MQSITQSSSLPLTSSLQPHLLPSYKPHHFPSHEFPQSAFPVPLRLVQPDTYLSLPCSPSFIPRPFSFSRTSHFPLSSLVPSFSFLRPYAFPSLDPSHFRILHTVHFLNLMKYSSCILLLMPPHASRLHPPFFTSHAILHFLLRFHTKITHPSPHPT